jgi:hypothetical protein
MVTRSAFTPPFLNAAKRVSIIRSPVKDTPCLFYNETEFEDAVKRYCINPTTRLSLDNAARTYLFSITNGHPGAVFSVLSYFFKVFTSRRFLIDERLTATEIWICIQAWRHSAGHKRPSHRSARR